MYYECAGIDVSNIITAINARLDVSEQIPESASSDDIVTAIDMILKKFIDLSNTKSATTIPDTATADDIVNNFKSIVVSVQMSATADFLGNSMWQAKLAWNETSNSGSDTSTPSQGDSTVTRTENFTVF